MTFYDSNMTFCNSNIPSYDSNMSSYFSNISSYVVLFPRSFRCQFDRVNHTVCIGMYGTVYVGHRFIQYYGLHRGYSTRKLIK